jgi:nitrite reductase/ring-hydroxylating ferredoxin subunit/alkylhydroperoxidase/carboxymuconolactone decarboxylase family protein YurZ
MGKPKGKSQGLAFLQKARPEAVSHLLKFFKESARHLDPKTRFLISTVTKVINFSERGLEQYVKRALAEGATADEVIDAILCSYPCAGLTKVVDAIDVILDMGLPEFESLAEERRAESSEPPLAAPSESGARRDADGWVDIGTRDDFSEGGRLDVRVDDRWLAVFDVGGDVRVIDNLCPHKGTPLVGGQLCDDIIVCPLHHWQFNVRTGISPTHPGAKVGTYDVRVEDDGRIRVKL